MTWRVAEHMAPNEKQKAVQLTGYPAILAINNLEHFGAVQENITGVKLTKRVRNFPSLTLTCNDSHIAKHSGWRNKFEKQPEMLALNMHNL
jgi:hypothetical protein